MIAKFNKAKESNQKRINGLSEEEKKAEYEKQLKYLQEKGMERVNSTRIHRERTEEEKQQLLNRWIDELKADYGVSE